jgi:hypothetical protein
MDFRRPNLLDGYMASIIVWDIETVPDLKGFAAANGHDGKSDEEIRVAMGDKFPKHIYHSIICIGALVAHHEDGHWTVGALGAPHVGERSEKGLISAFVDRIAELSPNFVRVSVPSKPRQIRMAGRGPVGRLSRMHIILEILEAFPIRFHRLASRARRVDRRLDQL